MGLTGAVGLHFDAFAHLGGDLKTAADLRLISFFSEAVEGETMHALVSVWWVVPTTLLTESAGSHTNRLAKVFAVETREILATARIDKVFAVPAVHVCRIGLITWSDHPGFVDHPGG